MTYINIGENIYPAEFDGKKRDEKWDGRESIAITLEMTYEQAMQTFVDELPWSLIYEQPERKDASGNVLYPAVHKIHDNSDFSVAGPVTDNRDGTVTVKMGKPTADELLAIVMGG